jgi:hypothetical protein
MEKRVFVHAKEIHYFNKYVRIFLISHLFNKTLKIINFYLITKSSAVYSGSFVALIEFDFRFKNKIFLFIKIIKDINCLLKSYLN